MDFKVKHADGTEVRLISSANKSVVTSAVQKRKLCGEDTVTINLTSAEYIEFRIGDTLDVFGTTYTINQLPTVKKINERNYEYTLVFEGLQYALIDHVFLMPDNTQGNNLMLDLAGMMTELVANINRDNSGKTWKFTCPADTEYKNLSLTEKNCLQVLQQLCQEWGTEFTIVEGDDDITIKVGQAGSVFPITFTYGQNGGIYELNREKGATDIVTRLFCYGGTQNLTYYRHNRLCLPSKSKNESYIEDATAQATYGLKEAVKNFDDIYPNRIGTVTSVSGCAYNEFIDNTMNFDLNEKWPNTTAGCEEWLALKGLEDTTQNRNIYFNDVAGTATRYLMPGATAKIHFNTGALAGYECDLHAYDAATKKFTLVPLVDENGYDFPSKTNTTFRIGADDEYVILEINLPERYKEDAEEELQDAAEEYFATVCNPQPKYTLELEPLALEKIVDGLHSTGDREIFATGDAVKITDTENGIIEASIRIDSFDRDLINPYKYKLSLTDEITYTAQVRTLIEVNQIKRVIQETGIADPNKIRRGWKDAEELYNMVFDTEGQIYGEKIQPLSIDTTMLKVGARSQQLTLQNVTFQPNYLGNPARLEISGGYLVHLSIDPSGPVTWTMSAASLSNLASTGLYVYARVLRSGSTGVWLVSDQQIVFDSESGYYNFLIGTLGSVDSNTSTRTFSATYGFSTINGRYIKTGRIQSADGATYFDLDTGTITGNITFNSQGQQALETLINDKVDAEVGALDISNRNFITNSGLIDTTKSSFSSTTATPNPSYIFNDVTSYGTNTSSKVIVTFPALESGQKYTFSCKYNRQLSAQTLVLSIGGTTKTVTTVNDTAWRVLDMTFTASSSTTSASLYINQSSDGWVVAFKEFKLEKGEAATEWSVAPEDVGFAVDTANSAKDAVNNLEIGGRNLLSQSADEWTNTASTAAWKRLNITTTPLEVGGKYQLSFDAKTSNGTDVFYAALAIADTSQIVVQGIQPTTSYTRIVVELVNEGQFATNINSIVVSNASAFGRGNGNNTGTLYIKNFKLEKGNKATDWTPAPEDNEAEFYEQTRRNLKATCSTAAGTATKVITCDEWQTSMLQAETRISIKVDNDGLAYGGSVATYHPLLSIGGTSCYLYYKGQYSGYGYQHETPAIWAAGMEVKLEYMGMSGTISYGSSTLESRHSFRIIDEGEFDSAVIFSKALKGQTDIFGGLILTETMLMRDEGGRQRAGMSGIGGIALFAGGTMYQAQNGTAKVIITHTGDAKFGVVSINGSGNGEMTMDSGGARRLTIKNEALTLSQGGIVYNADNSNNDNTPTSGTALTSTAVTTSEQTHTIFALTQLQSPTNKYLFDVHFSCNVALNVATVGTAGYVQLFLDFYNGNEWVNFDAYELYNGSVGSRTASINVALRYNNTGLGYAQIGLRARYKTTASSAGQSTVAISQPKWYYYCDNNKANMQIANNGLTYYLNSANQFTAKTNNDQSMSIDLKGNVSISGSSISMPGVLVAARVTSAGGWDPKYMCEGKTKSECKRTATGKYQIKFTGFSVAPAVIATAQSSAASYYTGATVYANAVSSGVLTIEIHTRNNDSLTDTDFNLVLFGIN